MSNQEQSPEYLVPAARAVIFDQHDRVLLIRRGDNREWGLPAGGMEPGESITDCMRREVLEETGINVHNWHAFAIYSEPRFRAPNRPSAQLITMAYRVDEWDGELQSVTDETIDARWFTLDQLRALPDLMEMYLETIEDCFSAQTHDGFIVK